MKNKALLFIGTAIVILSACISSCKSTSGSQNIHIACQGFSLTCQHGGTCGEGNLGNNQYNDTCTCPGTYEGVTCETPARNKFIGTYIGVMSQQNTGSTTVNTFPDTVTIVANTDETKATVEHLYQFMIASPYSPAAYDTLVFLADQSFLVDPNARYIQVNFTDQANTQLHFACPEPGGFGGLANSWFDGTRQ